MTTTGTPGAQQTQSHDCPFGCGPINDESTVGGPGFALIPACPVHGWVCELLDQSAGRLTTAETERDRAQWAAADLAKQRDSLRSQAVAAHRAAEARVEALERALETLATAEDFVDEEDYQAFARAALACPPQQRGEK